jgi:ectoine hydroxylase-related dioxygenase (phytanoyl-CoA dioxygenase family)
MTGTPYAAGYADGERAQLAGEIDQYVEQVSLKGYCVLPAQISSSQLESWREKVDAVYLRQETAFGRDALAAIGELDTCRIPLLYDFAFCELAQNPLVLKIVRRMVGEWVILHLQNAVIVRPQQPHHQASWHRDLPYQNFVSSRPLAMSALLTLDDFSEETGGTTVLPLSHRSERLPSESYLQANAAVPSATAGSIILFDSMLFHKAGTNTSGAVRRGINHVYTVPIIKQQYDLPRALAGRGDISPELAKLLGFTAQVPRDDTEWRGWRLQRFGVTAKPREAQ